jgi:hypothetical protein
VAGAIYGKSVTVAELERRCKSSCWPETDQATP